MPFPYRRRRGAYLVDSTPFMVLNSLTLPYVVFGLFVLPFQAYVGGAIALGALLVTFDMRHRYGPRWYLHAFWVARSWYRWACNPQRVMRDVLRGVLGFISHFPGLLFGSYKPEKFRPRFAAAEARAERWYQALWGR